MLVPTMLNVLPFFFNISFVCVFICIFSSFLTSVFALKMTGDDNITSIHVEAALQQCVTFVGVNSTLQQTNPVVTTNLQSLCPGNCSDNGFCTNGKIVYECKTITKF